jgi:recombination protein RecT
MTNAGIQKGIAETIGKENVTRFVSSIISAVQATPALKECTNSSILSGAILGESLKLAPSPQLGQFYLVPYDNRKAGIKQAQFQLGWKGYVQLAIRSGQYASIVASEVKEGELKSFNAITEEFEIEPLTEDKRQKAKTVGYYAMFKLMNGFKKEIYWSKEKMEAHAKQYSAGYQNDLNKGTKYTFWSKSFDDMAKKTMLRQLISKWGIMSIDMQKAYEGDMAVVGEDGSLDYVDNQETPESVIDSVAVEVAENQNSIPFDAEG